MASSISDQDGIGWGKYFAELEKIFFFFYLDTDIAKNYFSAHESRKKNTHSPLPENFVERSILFIVEENSPTPNNNELMRKHRPGLSKEIEYIFYWIFPDSIREVRYIRYYFIFAKCRRCVEGRHRNFRCWICISKKIIFCTEDHLISEIFCSSQHHDKNIFRGSHNYCGKNEVKSSGYGAVTVIRSCITGCQNSRENACNNCRSIPHSLFRRRFTPRSQ